MSDQEDAGYYGVRAGEERRKAETAENSSASTFHADLAARCQKLSSDPDLVLPTYRNAGEGSDSETVNTHTG